MDRHYGSRYDEKLSTTEIARRFREDVKEAKRRGELPKGLKLGVRTKSYSGGSSIRVEIKEAPGIRILNPEHLERELRGEPTHGIPWIHDEAKRLVDRLDGMLRAYNYDGSDSMTDYFDVNFYGSVDFDYDLTNAERDAFKAGTLPPLPPPEPAAEPEPPPPAPKPAPREPKPERPPLPSTGLAIRFGFSESPFVDENKVFRSFVDADRHLKEAETKERAELIAAGEEWLGYRKTDFEVAIDGEVYKGRYDIGSDAPTIAEHILAFADPSRNGFLRRAGDDEKAYFARWARLVKVAVEREAPPTLKVMAVDPLPGIGLLGNFEAGAC